MQCRPNSTPLRFVDSQLANLQPDGPKNILFLFDVFVQIRGSMMAADICYP